MPLYVVSYDLHRPIQNYPKLKEAIEAFAPFCKPLESFYVVTSNFSALEMRKYLGHFIDKNDKLIVCETTKPFYGFLSSKDWDCLNNL